MHGANMLLEAKQWVARAWPHWNRTQGRDHIWLVTHDEGSCWVPSELRASTILSHWGRKVALCRLHWLCSLFLAVVRAAPALHDWMVLTPGWSSTRQGQLLGAVLSCAPPSFPTGAARCCCLAAVRCRGPWPAVWGTAGCTSTA